jgi:hypothetical protein
MEQTFVLTITGTENGEWQGHVTGQDNQLAEFQSVLELIKLIRKELDKTK